MLHLPHFLTLSDNLPGHNFDKCPSSFDKPYSDPSAFNEAFYGAGVSASKGRNLEYNLF